jgi:hypothetical protein
MVTALDRSSGSATPSPRRHASTAERAASGSGSSPPPRSAPCARGLDDRRRTRIHRGDLAARFDDDDGVGQRTDGRLQGLLGPDHLADVGPAELLEVVRHAIEASGQLAQLVAAMSGDAAFKIPAA